MKWPLLVLSIMILLGTGAFGQFGSYETSAPGGAPTPTPPSSAESLGLEAPIDIVTSQQTPSAQERTQILMSATEDAAYDSAPPESRATSANPIYNEMIVPSGTYAPNHLYISYAPRTIAGCNLYANLPLWMQVSGTGHIWFYEWYPNGMLDTQYAGSVYYPNWYKRWFFADSPGWHILQYYCNGWSNFAYIYVHGPSSYWVNPSPSPDPMPYPYPYWDSQITYTYPPTGHTFYSYKSTISFGKDQDGMRK